MGDYGRQRGQERVSAVGGYCAFDVRVPLVYVACRQIDIGKLRKLAVDFELTIDVDALHREVDLDQSGSPATKIIDSLLQSHCLLVPLKNHTRHRRSVVRRVHAHDIEGIPKSPPKFLTIIFRAYMPTIQLQRSNLKCPVKTQTIRWSGRDATAGITVYCCKARLLQSNSIHGPGY